jgi:protein phosphatase 2C family protein 2/3
MIISRLFPPAHRKEEKWPHCSFFAVYDGHGGKDCSSFLRDNLHNYLVNDPAFPEDPQTALLNAFATAEKEFTEQAIKKRIKSGSCALVLVLLDKIGVLANLGDSRCIVSESKSNKISQLSTEHTPEKESEELRIKKAGGEVYLEKIGRKHISRVIPGNLSISRSIGDIDTKIYELGGVPDVIIAIPEIKIFKIHSDTDFILLGSDGIFERLDKREVVRIVAESAESIDGETHEKLAKGIENVIVESINRGSEDNVTLLGIAFDNLDKLFQKQETNFEL